MDISESKVDAYIRKPCRCMDCGSEWIEGDSVRVHDGMAFQDMRCNECDLLWVDEYALCDVAYVRRA